MTRFPLQIFALAGAVFSLGATVTRADLTMVQKVEGLGQEVENTSRFKGTKTRVDIAPGTSLIVDLKTGEMINLMHVPKTYFKASNPTARAVVESPGQEQGGSPGSKPALAATGRTGTISGYPATEYTCNAAGVKMTLWLTKSLPDYETALKEMSTTLGSGPMGPLLQCDGLDMASLPGFPIRTVLAVKPGETMTRTVISVNTKPVPDSEFEIPADYKEIAVPVLTPPAAALASPTPP